MFKSYIGCDKYLVRASVAPHWTDCCSHLQSSSAIKTDSSSSDTTKLGQHSQNSFVLEVWGLRCLKKVNLFTISNPLFSLTYYGRILRWLAPLLLLQSFTEQQCYQNWQLQQWYHQTRTTQLGLFCVGNLWFEISEISKSIHNFKSSNYHDLLWQDIKMISSSTIFAGIYRAAVLSNWKLQQKYHQTRTIQSGLFLVGYLNWVICNKISHSQFKIL